MPYTKFIAYIILNTLCQQYHGMTQKVGHSFRIKCVDFIYSHRYNTVIAKYVLYWQLQFNELRHQQECIFCGIIIPRITSVFMPPTKNMLSSVI